MKKTQGVFERSGRDGSGKPFARVYLGLGSVGPGPPESSCICDWLESRPSRHSRCRTIMKTDDVSKTLANKPQGRCTLFSSSRLLGVPPEVLSKWMFPARHSDLPIAWNLQKSGDLQNSADIHFLKNLHFHIIFLEIYIRIPEIQMEMKIETSICLAIYIAIVSSHFFWQPWLSSEFHAKLTVAPFATMSFEWNSRLTMKFT